MSLKQETAEFVREKAVAYTDAAQRVALQLLCGLDLTTISSADAATRRSALRRIERLISRERLKGLTHHWSYDLNRHIALKQARDRLSTGLQPPALGLAGAPGEDRG